MKQSTRLILTFVLFSLLNKAQNFTCVRGSSVSGIPGIYGAIGVPSPTIDPGGRHGAATWTDQAGNLWLFGGEGYDATNTFGHLGDLWKYSIASNQWTYVRGSATVNTMGTYGTMGVAAPGNEPGAREFAAHWVDAAGNFWMFGGAGYSAITATVAYNLGDLWKYNPSTNQWTWVNGFNNYNQNGVYGSITVPSSSNHPGCRQLAVGWADNSGNLWMFGGRGYDAASTNSNVLNDMWRYNIASNQWTWMNGTNLVSQNGVAGTQYVPSSSNTPGGRSAHSAVVGANGDFWLYGGLGFASGTVQAGYLNDLWKYSPATNQWTWINGNALNKNILSKYGHKGITSSTVCPGGRYSPGLWADTTGNLWLFGGHGWATDPNQTGELNDFFKYDVTTNQWTWYKGDSLLVMPGLYGTYGVASPTNMPGSREYNTWWPVRANTIWLIGGEGIDGQNHFSNHMNDLWKFGVPCNPDSVQSLGQYCPGVSATLTAFNQFPSNVNWYNTPTSGTSIGSGSVLITPTLVGSAAGSTVAFYASSNGCTVTPRTAFTLSVFPLPQLTLTPQGNACNNSTVTISASGGTSFVWSNGSSGTFVTFPAYVPLCTIAAQGTDANGCVNTITLSLPVYPNPTVSITTPTNGVCVGDFFYVTASGAQTYSWNNSKFGSTTNYSASLPTTTIIATGTDTNGCQGTTTVNVAVTAFPNFTIAPKVPLLCVGNTNTLTVNGTGSVYVWDGTLTATSITIQPKQNTTYTVVGSVNGCSTTVLFTQTLSACDGVAESGSTENIVLYPNPGNGSFRIAGATAGALLTIFDATGKVVLTSRIDSNEQQIASGLKAGIYLVRLERSTQPAFVARLIVTD